MRTLRTFIDQRLHPPYLFMVSGAVLVVGIALAVVAFVTSDKGRTAVGIPFGADFAGFYVAAQILDRGQPELLYDRALHARLYHELLANVDEKEIIPYVHPPFVAGVLRPLTWMRYENAVLVWMLISAVLYTAGIVLVLKATAWIGGGGSAEAEPSQNLLSANSSTLRLVLLLAFSFEPFLFECWLGGQLSAVGFFSFALAYYLLQHNRPIVSGMALGLCFYKPTLLVLAIPLLLVARRWHVLLGVLVTEVALVLVSILMAGWQVNVDYVNVLLSFRQSTDQGELVIRTWKYVDLHHALQQLLGPGSPWEFPLFFVLFALPFAWLAWKWWRWDRMEPAQQTLLWAMMLTWTPVLNLYVGIYDSILVVQGVLLVASWLNTQVKSERPLIDSGFAYILVLLYLVPWITQGLALRTLAPLYTITLLALGVFVVRRNL